MDGLTKSLETYLVKQAPSLPKNIKEILVKIAPWLEVVGVVMTVPAIFALLGFNAMMYGTTYGGYVAARNFSLSTIFLLAGFVLMILAIPGLFNRTKVGWNYVYYSVLVSAVYSLISYQFFGMVVGTLISLYLLFQVKSYYK